ncbi:hypothetical protein V8G54_017102 [Vigna mungo]|uniref:Uncharacterized protein n=1 Tax=Vigna mungo TaxID=3915 RepID=A0AAQ3RZY9_VIGMU
MHGVDVTIITTPQNATVFQKSVDLDSSRGRPIRTHLVTFPAAEVGLPPGIEAFNGLAILQPRFEQLFHDLRPDFIVTDMFHPWTVEAAAKLRIPRIMFHGASYLARSAAHAVEQYAPHLASAYYEHYKGVMGTKSWGIGPVSLWANQDASDKAARGYAKEDEGEEGWLKWLNTKAERSVLYDSGKDFIWVVRKNDKGGEGEKFLEEFEERMKESKKGYLIWGWAPQLLILENPAIGGLVTHCGWNTVVESVNAGLPMVTWPLFAEHFFNEKLVVDVLKIGVSVGAKEWRNWNDFGGEIVKAEDIGNAIGVMMSEKGEDMRRRSKTLSGAAKKAIEDGGSSHNNLNELIRELNQIKLSKAQETAPNP